MMNKINSFLLTGILCFGLNVLRSQVTANELPKGIEQYNKLIEFLPQDSVRYGATGLLLEGWMEDYYNSGKLKHRGFYKKGKLILFKNFFENGLCERSLSSSDPLHHEISLYDESGNLRKQSTYYNSLIKKVSEFYPNEAPKSKTDYDKEGRYVVLKRTWYPNGGVESELRLIEPKSKKYAEKYYYDNGHLKEEGNLLFSMESKLYKKNGTWNVYDLEGKNKKSVNFN